MTQNGGTYEGPQLEAWDGFLLWKPFFLQAPATAMYADYYLMDNYADPHLEELISSEERDRLRGVATNAATPVYTELLSKEELAGATKRFHSEVAMLTSKLVASALKRLQDAMAAQATAYLLSAVSPSLAAELPPLPQTPHGLWKYIMAQSQPPFYDIFGLFQYTLGIQLQRPAATASFLAAFEPAVAALLPALLSLHDVSGLFIGVKDMASAHTVLKRYQTQLAAKLQVCLLAHACAPNLTSLFQPNPTTFDYATIKLRLLEYVDSMPASAAFVSTDDDRNETQRKRMASIQTSLRPAKKPKMQINLPTTLSPASSMSPSSSLKATRPPTPTQPQKAAANVPAGSMSPLQRTPPSRAPVAAAARPSTHEQAAPRPPKPPTPAETADAIWRHFQVARGFHIPDDVCCTHCVTLGNVLPHRALGCPRLASLANGPATKPSRYVPDRRKPS
ncbi:hypothetical protein SPRG_04868 [Saprolegnia parasitica CBS 223.65]|uniref:Uncharacterized protein n=1 Tax=Saprolegnia parasitica (strain CBS 223.65) TaxID=695850 RepID=A0A067CTA3_SAPPC|nr:hypothetical protein SPRG_04868 [Saprolegnia parasitica CBS 223.65]KDO29751.1 hypothetical protein SPRG_04868 [Saprolegnia parasitica CBS 223.65]|eukprot:XP_012199399.1 hypothetical protein SPRG_04868 [Saprolegnia parasitica CBS 223.65]